MCPDRELLSAYVDGEVPSPWKERLAEHLASCAACAAVVESYADLSRRLEGSGCPGEAAIVERGREALELAFERGRAADLGMAPQGGARRGAAGWRRRVSLPLPLAAAAALAMLFLGAFTASSVLAGGKRGGPALAAAEIAPDGAHEVNMDSILRYLDAQNAQVTLTINLPTGATFEGPGNPVIVRAPRSSSTKTVNAVAPAPAEGGANP